MDKITPEQALGFIGNCLANETLKLSQKEHLTALECFKKLVSFIKDSKCTECGNTECTCEPKGEVDLKTVKPKDLKLEKTK